jgi:hypothetical protein
VAHRARFVGQRTPTRNRLHRLLTSHNVSPPEAAGAWADLPLTPIEALRLQHDRQMIATLSGLIPTVDAEMARLSVDVPWSGPMLYCQAWDGSPG